MFLFPGMAQRGGTHDAARGLWEGGPDKTCPLSVAHHRHHEAQQELHFEMSDR